MVQTVNLTETAALEQLLGAEQNGTLTLVDEEGRPLALLASLSQRCWARLTDAEDGQVYVHELRGGSSELTEPRYLELLGLNI